MDCINEIPSSVSILNEENNVQRRIDEQFQDKTETDVANDDQVKAAAQVINVKSVNGSVHDPVIIISFSSRS